MRSLEQIEHPNDIEFQVEAKDLLKLFVRTAEEVFSLITGGKTHNKAGMGFLVYKKVKYEYIKERIECEAPDQESLLQFWLTDLIEAYQRREILFQDFDIQELSDTQLKASCYGPLVDEVGEPKVKIEKVLFKRCAIAQKEKSVEADLFLELK